MKQKTLLILLLVLVVLLGAAYALYNGLAEELQPDLLQTTPTQPTEEEETSKVEETEQSTEETTDNVEQTNEPTQETEANVEETMPMAPDVTLYDADGNAVRLSDFCSPDFPLRP